MNTYIHVCTHTGKVEFNHQTFLPVKLNRSAAGYIPRKKAEFTLIKHKGFWPFVSEEELGRVRSSEEELRGIVWEEELRR